MRPLTGIRIFGIRLGVIALSTYWIFLFLGTHWPAGAAIAPEVSDKFKHFSGYFILAILCCYVSKSSSTRSDATAKRLIGVTLVLTLYACLDELTQSFSPGRHPDMLDALADLGGILAAVGLYCSLRLLFAKLRVTFATERGQAS